MNKIERFVLGMAIFCLPFGLGFAYSHVVKSDLIFLSDFLLFILYALWLYRTNLFSNERPRFGKFSLIAFLTILWSLFSMISAIAATATAIGIFMLVKVFLFYIYLVNNLKTRSDLMLVVTMLVYSLLFQGLLGTTQSLLGRTVGLEFLGEIPKSFHKEVSRVRGTMGYPNQYGAFLILVLPLAFSLAVFAKRSFFKLGMIAGAGFGLMGLFLSLSRSSWGGFLLSMMVFAVLLFRRGLLKPRYVFAIFVLAVAVVVIAVINWDVIQLRFETGADGRWRKTMIEIAFPIIAGHPIFGVGLNNYQWHSYDQFQFWHPVHNEFLRLAAETGIPGFVFFTSMFIIFLRECYKNFLGKDTLMTAVAIGVFCGVIAFLLAINIGPEYQHYRIKLTFWVLAGIVFSMQRIKLAEKRAKLRQKAVAVKETLPSRSRPIPQNALLNTEMRRP